MPVVAIRRLLEFTEAASGTYLLICDQDLAGSGVIHREIIWDRPELLFPCPDCRGRGEYVGLLERETCRTCAGRNVVPV
jgi:DnaJ-class molecular chaperone